MNFKQQFFASLLLSLAFAANSLAAEVVTHPENTHEIDSEQIRSILIGKQRFWADGTEIIIAILNNSSSENVLKSYCGMTSSKFKNHWQRISFSGRGKMPVSFRTSKEITTYINDHPGAIAILPQSAPPIAKLNKSR
jgi:hypothetical protein